MGSFFEKKRGGWRYDFRLYGSRHRAPRAFSTKRDCDRAEQKVRDRLMLQHAGVTVPATAARAARFYQWAGVYSEWARAQQRLGLRKQTDSVDADLSSVLRFWGARPTAEGDYVHPTAPYYDLTLADPIEDPSWIRKWDAWMDAEQIAGSTRNHYNSTMSRLYWLAMQAEYRDASGAPAYNPFKDRPRTRWKRRTATLSPEQIEQWIQHASYHTRLAISIAVLNPKFRLANVLQLEWSDVDLESRIIRVWDHKTDARGEALVAAMPDQLANILRDARDRHPKATRVILYRGVPVKSIDESLRNAAIASGLPWGRFTKGGVTFHTIRHFASTQLSRMGVPPDQRQPITGHADLKMEMWYTHLFPEGERVHAEALSRQVAIEAHVLAGPNRIGRRRQPASTTAEGGLSGEGGTKGGLSIPKSGITGGKRELRGLRRGPQKRKADDRK